MPSNIEIKARVADFDHKCAIAEQLSGSPPQLIQQRDTFFPCKTGRLKLREFADGRGELISYTRPDTLAPKQSDYSICPVASAETMRRTLAAALGTSVEVLKLRKLYLVGQTRIHLNVVEGLGAFLELEVVLQAGQTAETGRCIANDLMQKLEVDEMDLFRGAYADLLTE